MSKKLLMIVNVNQFGYSAGHYHYSKYLREYFEIIFLCRDLGLKKIKMDGVTVLYEIPGTNKISKLSGFIIFVLKNCYHLKPNIVFLVYFKACFLIPLLYRYGNCILDIRTGSLKRNKFIRALYNYTTNFQSLFFNKVIILSESLRKVLSIRKEKTLILPLGADILYDGKHTFDKMNILYVGTLDGRRISETIEGVSHLLHKRPELNNKLGYTIIGFGDEIEIKVIRETIVKNNLDSIVTFAGRKTYDELPEYFAKSNVGVCYIPKEAFYEIQPSTKIFEYSLSGLITIATNTYENKLLINKNNGILCEDNALSFSESLEIVYENMTNYDEQKNRTSLSYYKWENLVKNKLYPFLSN